MVNRTIIMIEPPLNAIRLKMSAKTLLFSYTLAALIFTMSILVGEAEAQIRRPGRLRKQIEKLEKAQQQRKATNKSNSPSDPEQETTTASSFNGQPPTPKNGAQPGKHSLDGVRERGLPSIFRQEERDLIIPGFGNPAALMILFRQLELSDQQRQDIRAIRGRVGNRLQILQRDQRELDLQLAEAIYGENFDPKRVEELAAQVAERQGEMVKLRASIEAQLRQLMTPDQFFVFRGLIGEMVLPQRRVLPAQLRQMNQRRGGAPTRPNQPNFPR